MSLNKNKRTRNWAFIVYPESAPENWRDILNDIHTPWFESPLHDKDINPTGELKKSHYHVIICFESIKSYEQICEITDSIKATYPQRCENVCGYVRYFCHIDNPEKYQYDIKSIISHNGADLQEFLKPNSSTRYQYIAEMQEFIDKYNITEFYIFSSICRNSHRDDWWPLLCDNSCMLIREYIKSRRCSSSKGSNFVVDEKTGEVIEEIL